MMAISKRGYLTLRGYFCEACRKEHASHLHEASTLLPAGQHRCAWDRCPSACAVWECSISVGNRAGQNRRTRAELERGLSETELALKAAGL